MGTLCSLSATPRVKNGVILGRNLGSGPSGGQTGVMAGSKQALGGEPETTIHGALIRALSSILSADDPAQTAEVFLGAIERILGASRVAWIEAGEGQVLVWESQQRSLEASPDEDLWRGLAEGEVCRVASDRLARSARSRRRGLREVTLSAVAEARLLWIESDLPLVISDAELRLAASSAAQVFELSARLRGLSSEAVLRRRGVAALAMVHDLRHQLVLGLLHAQRARETEGADAERSLEELDLALTKARAISEDALSSPQLADARVTSTRLRDLLQEEARATGELGSLEGRGGGRIAIALRCSLSLRVRATESTLSRLIRNLLLNAFKASSAGDRILVSAERKGGRVIVRIEDSGRGMDARKVRQLFTSDQTDAGGAGCGTLSILACVEELGAELEVESAVGRGTRVSLSLAEASDRGPESPVELLLLVDGHGERRAERSSELERQGRRVLQVSRCGEALFELERVQPARILVERGLPSDQLKQLTERAAVQGIEVQVLDYRDRCLPLA